MEPSRAGCWPVRENTMSRLSAVFTATSLVPSGVMATGDTWGDSKLTKLGTSAPVS